MRPASSTLAILGWSIIASACRSASKRAITCRVSMPGLMIFRATRRLTGSFCSAMIDHAHAAFADLLQQLVGADLRARLFGDGLVESLVRQSRPEAAIQESFLLFVHAQQISTHAPVPRSSPHACRCSCRASGSVRFSGLFKEQISRRCVLRSWYGSLPFGLHKSMRESDAQFPQEICEIFLTARLSSAEDQSSWSYEP